jgi:BolA family transcriptional regulator, general stress-responsive regulator
MNNDIDLNSIDIPSLLHTPEISLHRLIEQRLQTYFSPRYLSVLDESHEHAGHAGSVGGGKHFSVTMQAVAFMGLTAVKKHQLVYAALKDYLDTEHAINQPDLGYIHALKLQLSS